MRLTILFTLLLLIIQPAAYAGFYKWVDENGQVHYGERPGSPEAEKLDIRSDVSDTQESSAADEDSQKTAEAETTEQQAGEQPPAEPPVEVFVEKKIPAKEKRQLCRQAKEDIASISSRGRMREINEKGEYIYLSEAQRQQRLSAAKKRKREYCN